MSTRTLRDEALGEPQGQEFTRRSRAGLDEKLQRGRLLERSLQPHDSRDNRATGMTSTDAYERAINHPRAAFQVFHVNFL